MLLYDTTTKDLFRPEIGDKKCHGVRCCCDSRRVCLPLPVPEGSLQTGNLYLINDNDKSLSFSFYIFIFPAFPCVLFLKALHAPLILCHSWLSSAKESSWQRCSNNPNPKRIQAFLFFIPLYIFSFWLSLVIFKPQRRLTLLLLRRPEQQQTRNVTLRWRKRCVKWTWGNYHVTHVSTFKMIKMDEGNTLQETIFASVFEMNVRQPQRCFPSIMSCFQNVLAAKLRLFFFHKICRIDWLTAPVNPFFLVLMTEKGKN